MIDDSDNSNVCGVILAGGQASRMNFLDKPLLSIANESLIEHVITSAKPQVGKLVISVNRNLEKYEKYNIPLVIDIESKRSGPLVGICSAMKWYCDQNLATDYLACFPADVPIFPVDIVSVLLHSLQDEISSDNEVQLKAKVAWCQTGEQIQPLFSLWSFKLLPALESAIADGVYGPKLFFEHHPNCKVLLPAAENGMFFNVNTAEDLTLAETFLPRDSDL